MKTHYQIQFVLLIISDFIYIAAASATGHISTGDVYFSLSLTNLFLGPIQFIPAVIMLFGRAPRNQHYNAYMILSVLTILTLILGFSMGNESIDIKIFGLSIQVFSFLMAHYFVYVLFRLQKTN